MHITFTLNLQLATHWKENMYICMGLRSSRVGSGRVVSGLEFGRWKHKTETNRPKTVRVGSGRVVSVLVETRPKPFSLSAQLGEYFLGFLPFRYLRFWSSFVRALGQQYCSDLLLAPDSEITRV